MVTKEKQLSVSEIAQRYGVSKQAVVRAIRAEKLKGYKVGWVWVVNETDLPERWEW